MSVMYRYRTLWVHPGVSIGFVFKDMRPVKKSRNEEG